MLNVDHLTKRYGPVTAVDGLSFEVRPGRVTGFLGPNGAGKTTTLRMLLGLAAPDSGTATINGVRYRDLPDPARTIGAALEADSFHPGRTAIEHLKIIVFLAQRLFDGNSSGAPVATFTSSPVMPASLT